MIAMSAQRHNKYLKVHVICSGLPYGNGESSNIFYEFFRRAWLSLHPDLAALPIIGSGNNRIPTIHIVDLARSIKFLIQNNIKQQYFFAVDDAKVQTQEKIIKAISEGMGSGVTKHVELNEVVEEEWSEFMVIDLKI